MKHTYEIHTVKTVEVEWTDTYFGVTHGFRVGQGTLKDDWVTVTARGAGATLTVYPCRDQMSSFMPRRPVVSLHDSEEGAMEAGGQWLGDRA
jgi:hypothetical protein